MTRRGLKSYVGPLVDDRRPKGYRARPEDADVIRFAISLRSRRPGTGGPDPRFVESLRRELADQAPSPAPSRIIPRRPLGMVVRTAALVLAVAAAAVTTTNMLDHPSAGSPAHLVTTDASLRYGVLRTPTGSTVGRVYVHGGQPSWMFVSLRARTPDQSVLCELELTNGSHLQVRTVQVHGGAAQLAHSVSVDVSLLKGVRLVTPQGATMASATFS